jgi:hypothetical protein
MLRDRRIEALRVLVTAAASGTVVFDDEFARRTLLEVIKAEQRVARFRSIASYGLLPISYLPVVGTPLAKAVEEAIGAAFAHSARQSLDWFYLISESPQDGAA